MKKPWQSKTLIVNVLVAILAIAWPPAHDYVVAHPDVVMYILAGVNVLLRLITKDKIGLEE